MTYFVEYATNLAAQSSFFCIGTNLAGQDGSTSLTHKNAVGLNSVFYRVGLQVHTAAH